MSTGLRARFAGEQGPRALRDTSRAPISPYEAPATVLLQHLIQIWPDSALQNFDQFSYFILGIPLSIYGYLLVCGHVPSGGIFR